MNVSIKRWQKTQSGSISENNDPRTRTCLLLILVSRDELLWHLHVHFQWINQLVEAIHRRKSRRHQHYFPTWTKWHLQKKSQHVARATSLQMSSLWNMKVRNDPITYICLSGQKRYTFFYLLGLGSWLYTLLNYMKKPTNLFTMPSASDDTPQHLYNTIAGIKKKKMLAIQPNKRPMGHYSLTW